MNPLIITPLKTSIFHKSDDLADFILRHIPPSMLKEDLVLAITSKIISLAEGRTLSKKSIDKKALIKNEAGVFLGEIGYGVQLTITHGIMVASAGIDESNSQDEEYILYPLDPYLSAENLRTALQRKTGLKNLGILLTDSRTGPLRLGVTGVALAFAGFHPLQNKIGHKDLFGRPLETTKVNLVDSLAASCVLVMGEADESCPLAIIENPRVEFTDTPDRKAFEVAINEDMYSPLYSHLIKK